MKTTKFVLLGLPIYLVLASSFRVIFNKELLSNQYYKLIIAFGFGFEVSRKECYSKQLGNKFFKRIPMNKEKIR